MVTMPLWYLILALSVVAVSGVAVGAWLRPSPAPAGEESTR